MDPLRVIFMGTPEFAVPSLEILIKNGINVVAVVTAADKPQGRGQRLQYSPVKECAMKYDLPVLQPTNLKADTFLSELRSFEANLQIVVAFRMLPETVWSMPRLGTFNLHASLLPQYRGAAPINWAIINGEKETGLTTFFLKHAIDTGSIIFQVKEPISDTDTVGTLYERLMLKGADLVLQTVRAIESGKFPSTPQDEAIAIKHAPKIFKETCEIDWANPSDYLYNFIRGLSPYPAAWTTLEGRSYKIFRADKVDAPVHPNCKPGEFVTDNETYLHMCTGQGHISIIEWQPEGKKRMNIQDFFRGNKL
jgi:methionyl-tRNA formyltransferase